MNSLNQFRDGGSNAVIGNIVELPLNALDLTLQTFEMEEYNESADEAFSELEDVYAVMGIDMSNGGNADMEDAYGPTQAELEGFMDTIGAFLTKIKDAIVRAIKFVIQKITELMDKIKSSIDAGFAKRQGDRIKAAAKLSGKVKMTTTWTFEKTDLGKDLSSATAKTKTDIDKFLNNIEKENPTPFKDFFKGSFKNNLYKELGVTGDLKDLNNANVAKYWVYNRLSKDNLTRVNTKVDQKDVEFKDFCVEAAIDLFVSATGDLRGLKDIKKELETEKKYVEKTFPSSSDYKKEGREDKTATYLKDTVDMIKKLIDLELAIAKEAISAISSRRSDLKKGFSVAIKAVKGSDKKEKKKK